MVCVSAEGHTWRVKLVGCAAKTRLRVGISEDGVVLVYTPANNNGRMYDYNMDGEIQFD